MLMNERKPQTYANHVRILPLYFFFVFPVLLLNLGYAGWKLVQEPSIGRGVGLLLALALVLLCFYARLFALRVQDRVIRLEMRLRLRERLPELRHEEMLKLSEDQLIALRFASDAELPGLVRDVLAGKLRERKDIKLAIKDWKPDYLRV